MTEIGLRSASRCRPLGLHARAQIFPVDVRQQHLAGHLPAGFTLNRHSQADLGLPFAVSQLEEVVDGGATGSCKGLAGREIKRFQVIEQVHKLRTLANASK